MQIKVDLVPFTYRKRLGHITFSLTERFFSRAKNIFLIIRFKR